MTNYTFETIRRRPDGSIDTAHYIAKGRAERSQAAHDILSTIGSPATPPKRNWRHLLPRLGRRAALT